MSEAPAMKITILTIFPEMFESVLNSSILGRARAQGILDIRCVDIRPFSDRKHKNTDDYPFGGGAGMVMLAQPILDAMRSVTGDDFQGRRIYLGPRGRTLSTAVARELAQEKELVLLCGHYEGVDQRALDTCIDEEISIGDYILTGGELAAMVLTDCVARFIPGGAGVCRIAGGGIVLRRAAGISAVHAPTRIERHGSAGCAAVRRPRENQGMAAH